MGAIILALAVGLVLLAWSADRFVAGAAAVARYAGVSALIVGMVVVGFGTSAPELVVSALAAWEGTPALALGNAYGSNICNIGLILGLVALLRPVTMADDVLRRDLPILVGVTVVSTMILWNGQVSRTDAALLLAIFAVVMGVTIRNAIKGRRQAAGDDSPSTDSPEDAGAESAQNENTAASPDLSRRAAVLWLIAGLALMVVASRLLVWGATGLARAFGIDELIIGLTIVAVGTSLPEMASSLAAIRKNEHDIALGNIVGSNLFNTLAVVGLAGVIHPMEVASDIFVRDIPVMAAFTLSLFVLGLGTRPRTVRRPGGILLLAGYAVYAFALIQAARAAV